MKLEFINKNERKKEITKLVKEREKRKRMKNKSFHKVSKLVQGKQEF
jgi:hypothetical protein